MDMENTPRNVILQVGSLIALYLSVSFILTLVFGLINVMIPNAADNYWEIESATESIRIGIAMVVVFYPTYLVLARLMNKFRRVEQGQLYQHITKWLIYLSLLVGGLILLGTLVTTIYTFLNGDITMRFVLKAGAVIVIVGAAFSYYVLDARGYWIKEEKKSIFGGAMVSVVVLLVLILGLQNIETPTTVREMKIDDMQLSDLQNIQWQIIAFMNTSSSTLPDTLEQAYEDSGALVPTAPEGREAYSYEKTTNGFELCATFRHNRTNDDIGTASYIDPTVPLKGTENWSYSAGRHCFVRTIR